MSLTVSVQTWKKVCPPEVFCENGPAIKFLSDNLTELKSSNPYLFTFLSQVLWGEYTLDPNDKTVRFDAVNCCVAICKMLAVENSLPVISKEVHDRVVADFSVQPKEFVDRWGNTILHEQGEKLLMAPVAICAANYTACGMEQQASFIQATASMVVRMLELQIAVA